VTPLRVVNFLKTKKIESIFLSNAFSFWKSISLFEGSQASLLVFETRLEFWRRHYGALGEWYW